VQSRLGAQRFTLWLGRAQFRVDGQVVTVLAADRFQLERIRRQYAKDLLAVARDHIGPGVQLDYAIQEPATPSAEVTNGSADRAVEASNTESAEETPASKANDAAPATLPLRAPESNPRPIARPPGRRWATLEEYVSSSASRLAATTVEMIVERPGQVSPLYLHGPSGVGKTHLLESVRSSFFQTRRQIQTLYITSEQFTTEYVSSVRGGLPSFRARFRSLGVLILDDLQFLRNKTQTIGELVHTIDTLAREGRQVVLAGDAPPEDLTDLGPELHTRLLGGLVCRIDPPDYETRLAIVRRLAGRLELRLPDGILEAVADRVPGNGRLLQGAVHRLQLLVRAGEPILTADDVSRALGDLARPQTPGVRLPDIERAVCEIFGVRSEVLHTRSRSKAVVPPRMLVMYLARRLTRSAYSEIGKYFGHNSHSTVIAAQKRVDTWRDSEHRLETASGSPTVQEILQQIERRLASTA
jgi:chromosomal replication initiator protein